MKRWLWIALLVAAVAAPAMAGDYEKCSADAQTCLNHMAAKYENRGWVGLELDQDEASGAMTVKRVVPGSPAVAAGFQAGDRIVAVNGIRHGDESEEAKAAMQKVWDSWTPGTGVSYTVARTGQERKLQVTLGQPPAEVVAQWIGTHMMQQHVTVAQAK